MIIDKESLEQAEEAAKLDPHAAYQVGEYYYTQGDYPQSVEWYKQAAGGDRPEPLALFALGYAYQTGQGVPVDLIQALHYYEAAASRDVPQACYNLAYFYQNGLGVERNRERADYYALRATECLKALTEELFAAKSAQLHIQNRYDDAIRCVAEKSDEWLRLSRERESQAGQLAQLQSRIDSLQEQLKQHDSDLARSGQELKKKEDAYQLLMQTHQQVLAQLEEAGKALSEANMEKEKAKAYASTQESRCEVLTERVSQKEQEIGDFLRLNTELQDGQLALRQQLDEALGRISAYEAEEKKNALRLSELNEAITKLKKSRVICFLLGLLVPIVIYGLIMIR